MTVVSAFTACPMSCDCLIASGAKHLTNIALDASCARLMHMGIFDKVIMAHSALCGEPGAGGIRKDRGGILPQGTIAERIRKHGMGLGGILVKTGLGTVAQEGKQTIELNGQEWILESALRADISLVRAATAVLTAT